MEECQVSRDLGVWWVIRGGCSFREYLAGFKWLSLVGYGLDCVPGVLLDLIWRFERLPLGAHVKDPRDDTFWG